MNVHAHHHHHPADYSRAFLIGIALNSAFIVIEVAYGLQAQSLALLADAGHNASDVLALLIAWIAALLSRRAATERFTYGLQSLSIFASVANALLLLVAVGGIGFEAFARLHASTPPSTDTVMAVAAIGVVINGLTAWLFHGHGHDLNMRGAFLHMAADAAISLGVVISAAIIGITGWLWLDPLVSLAILTVIAVSTWGLLKGSTNLALHAVPDHINPLQVREYLGGLPGVREVHDLHIWAMSTTGVALSAHLVMPAGHPGDRFLSDARGALRERFDIHHATLQIELGDAADSCVTDCEPDAPPQARAHAHGPGCSHHH